MQLLSSAAPVPFLAMTILVTGAAGFIGRHLVAGLRQRPDVAEVLAIRHDNWAADLAPGLARADAVFHLAGVNRPPDPAEFARVNAGLTDELCATATRLGRHPLIVFASSIQADQDNPYGRSKRAAEEILARWTRAGAGRAALFRLTNVFGPGCRPHYNSVVATFCASLAHGQPIAISDPARVLALVHVADVVAAFGQALAGVPAGACVHRTVPEVHRLTLGELAARLRAFRDDASSLPADTLGRLLRDTFLSYAAAASPLPA